MTIERFPTDRQHQVIGEAYHHEDTDTWDYDTILPDGRSSASSARSGESSSLRRSSKMIKHDNRCRPYVTLEIDLFLPKGYVTPYSVNNDTRARDLIVEALKAYGGPAEGLLEAMGEL